MKYAISRLLTLGVLTAATYATQAQTEASGDTLFYDDFNLPALNQTLWFPGLGQWGPKNNGVLPQNLHITHFTDPATNKVLGVLDAQAHGDLYKGPVAGIQKVVAGFDVGSPLGFAMPGAYADGYTRTGGVVWTKLRFGPAKYVIRMRPLQQPGGETAIWNYYEPVFLDPGSGLYTEIDVEMPANLESSGSLTMAGLNSYTTKPGEAPSEKTMVCNCVPTPVPNQADGNFHTYEIDWYDGTDGTTPRIEWRIDGKLTQTSTKDIPVDPAQLWVGNWPAAWSSKTPWNYATQDQYIDYVSISKLKGNSYPTEALPAPYEVKLATSSSTSVDLTWREAADSRKVAGYQVFANGILLEQTPSTHIELSNLNPGDEYDFTVKSINLAMTASAESTPLHIALPSKKGWCDAHPTSPILKVDAHLDPAHPGTISLQWDKPVIGTRDGNLGGSGCSIRGYEISRSGDGTRIVTGHAHSFTDLAVPAGRYRYDIAPFNEYGIGPTTSTTIVVP